MSKQKKLSCSVCQKEISESSRAMSEVADYVLHFCGTSCETKWEKRGVEPDSNAEIIKNPQRFYGSPNAVLEDENLSNELKLKVLTSWESDALEIQKAENENMRGENKPKLSEIKQAILSLKQAK